MASPRSRRLRRCRICNHGFTADSHVGDRQRVCSRPECQKARRQGTQASWRKRNPGYSIEWRAKKRAERSRSDVIDPPRLPPPLDGLPWELAQEEFGSIGADFIASLGRKVLGHAKDQSLSKTPGDKGESGKEDYRVRIRLGCRNSLIEKTFVGRTESLLYQHSTGSRLGGGVRGLRSGLQAPWMLVYGRVG